MTSSEREMFSRLGNLGFREWLVKQRESCIEGLKACDGNAFGKVQGKLILVDELIKHIDSSRSAH